MASIKAPSGQHQIPSWKLADPARFPEIHELIKHNNNEATKAASQTYLTHRQGVHGGTAVEHRYQSTYEAALRAQKKQG